MRSLVCWALLACGGRRTDTPPTNTPTAHPTAHPTASPTTPTPVASTAHPGTIVFVDLDSGELSERDVATVPDSIAWALVGETRVPVARVESRQRGSSREIMRYDAAGALLDTTISAPQP